MARQTDIESLSLELHAGMRGALAQAITLVESSRPLHREQAQSMLQALLPHTGQSIRLGISGVPGVGKSTFIEALGMHLISQGHRVAVLAIDPSSRRTGGSILGDKTRMAHLSKDDCAFIRPSPTGGHLGGVNRVTRESLLLCEAAGYDVVIVETVGVGQSETAVADMVDCFLMLMLPGAGDELQGIKKGVLEIADLIAVNKADGDAQRDARQARAAYQRALSILQPTGIWQPRALLLSALTGTGLPDLWAAVLEHRQQLEAAGELRSRRQLQQIDWLWATVEQTLLSGLRSTEPMRELARQVETAVQEETLTVPRGASQILKAWRDLQA